MERFLSRKQSFSKKKKGLRRIWCALLSPENKPSVLQKKGLPRIWSVFLSQKWLRIQVTGGAKVAQGGHNISRGGNRPPCPLTSRAYASIILHHQRKQ